MFEDKIIQMVGGTSLATLLLKFFYDYFKKSSATNSQVDANKELYNMLREEIDLMKTEIKILRSELEVERKKTIILEQLAIKSGIDVFKAYKENGIKIKSLIVENDKEEEEKEEE